MKKPDLMMEWARQGALTTLTDINDTFPGLIEEFASSMRWAEPKPKRVKPKTTGGSRQPLPELMLQVFEEVEGPLSLDDVIQGVTRLGWRSKSKHSRGIASVTLRQALVHKGKVKMIKGTSPVRCRYQLEER